jgi:hypothetical protein
MGNRFPSRTQSGPISRPAARAGIRCTEIYATLQMAGTPRFPVELTRRYRLTLKGGTWTVCDSGTAKTSHLHGSKGPEENRSEGPGGSAAFGPQLSCHRGIIHKRHKSTETQKAQKCGTPRASVAGLAALFDLTLFGSFVCQWAGHRLRPKSASRASPTACANHRDRRLVWVLVIARLVRRQTFARQRPRSVGIRGLCVRVITW